MTSITTSTKHTLKKAPPPPAKAASSKAAAAPVTASGNSATRRGSAPPLRPATLSSPQALASFQAKTREEQQVMLLDHFFRQTLGEQPTAVLNLSAPHTASTTRDRMGAAGDVAVAIQHMGAVYCLKTCGILHWMEAVLCPKGTEALFVQNEGPATSGGMRSIPSMVSLSSLDEVMTNTTGGNTSANNSGAGTDSKRGKTAPPNAREGCLLLIRALCETVGTAVEPFLVATFLPATLDECGSSSSTVREAAEDTTAALIALANPWAFSTIICPMLTQALNSSEWRVKSCALERLEQCARLAPVQVDKLIPTLIPAIAGQVWDTKAQVSKAARAALMAICGTNTNPDIKPTIPAVVNAICKPAETNKAVSALMGTTFVVPVNASTLAILCPVLARALKEKLAQHKRSACIVIANMSKLVISPQAVAPFGSLLVPELQKVAHNVQFEEIRDEALKALASLTQALGEMYNSSSAAATQGDNINQESLV